MDKDKGFKYIEHHEPDGSITKWYEHQCYPLMGVHWLPLEPNLGDSACPKPDYDQALYDPDTSKLIGFAFIHFARAKPDDAIKNIWLDYSGGGNVKSWTKLKGVWFAPTCLKDVELSSTHVFFGPAHFATKTCMPPTKCYSGTNCYCPKAEGKNFPTSKCFCASEGSQSCEEWHG